MSKITFKRIGPALIILVIIAGSIGAYMWFMPHRNVQAAKADAELTVKELTTEFTTDQGKANARYLSSDGNSKILIISGRVHNISTNQIGEKVIILKDVGTKAGVSATFTLQTSKNTESIKVDDIIRIKGAITAGNNFNPDLDLYEHAVLIQCDIVK